MLGVLTARLPHAPMNGEMSSTTIQRLLGWSCCAWAGMNKVAARQYLTLGIHRPGTSFSALLILLADASPTADGADKHTLVG